MKFQIPIDISVRCYICGEKLSAILFDPEGYDLVLSVEPCKNCGLKPLAPNICPRCKGAGSYADYIGTRACSLCNGTGKPPG